METLDTEEKENMTTFVVRKKTMTYGVILPSPDGWGIAQVQGTWYAVLEMHDGEEVMQSTGVVGTKRDSKGVRRNHETIEIRKAAL